MHRRKRIVIIGAGIGGLAAAALLSREFEVAVYERADKPGGKVRQVEIDGALIDSGPTVFTMRWVFDQIFSEAGHRFDDEIALHKLNILARHGWRDGSSFDLYANIAESAAAIDDFTNGRDGENYKAFCLKTKKIYETLRDPFMRALEPSFFGLVSQCNPFDLLETSPFSTLWSTLSKQFQDPRLRQLFGRYATYCGSSPFEAPATLMLIAHVEQDGVWAPQGGMQAVANALAAIAEKNGAKIHYGQHVEQVRFSNGRADGIELASTDYIPADAVIFNGDAAALHSALLGDKARSAIKLPASAERSQSAMTWSMNAKILGFEPALHTVFFSDDYKAEFDSVFKRASTPARPTTYVYAPDRIEELPQPTGDERLFCLINAPATGDEHAFSDIEVEECRRKTFAHLRACGLTIKTEPQMVKATSPADFAKMFPGTGGALYGMASHGWRASFQRPTCRTRAPGLYLAGGSVHPGPGVPMAALSGKAAAAAIIADYASI